MNLLDILACPTCKTAVELADGCLRCGQCGCEYPIIKGIPVMLPGGIYTEIQHETPLIVREGYDPWVHRMILQSLTDDQIVIDAGSGNVKLDDPCIVRMDIKLTPYVDLVADLHALPFLPNSVDYIFALAVFEHLRQPFRAAEEIYRVLKPGGYVYAEANFVFAYHGFPHHYFNISIHGLEALFSEFKVLRAGVAPYQMPGFALESILSSYLKIFNPETPTEYEFARMLENILKHPLYYYDTKLTAGETFRVAAGNYLIGIKQSRDSDTIIPQPILDVYASSEELQTRFPFRDNLFEPDNLMFWAKNEGRRIYPEIATYLERLSPFSKYLDAPRAFDRPIINGLPPIPPPDAQWIPDHRQGFVGQRKLRHLLYRAWFYYQQGGWRMLLRKIYAFLKKHAALVAGHINRFFGIAIFAETLLIYCPMYFAHLA